MDKVALQDKDCKTTGNEWIRSVVLGRFKKKKPPAIFAEGIT
jgi:hypothetical protein